MKTNLKRSIKSIEEAEAFLSELHENGESFNPDDSAFHISWEKVAKEHWPTSSECRQLNSLMGQVVELVREGWDPWDYLTSLDEEEERREKLARPTEY